MEMNCKKTSRTLLAGLFYVAITQPALARSTGRAIESDPSQKTIAPTKEDSAEYFSNAKLNVSAADAAEADALRSKTINQIKAITEAKGAKPNFELMLRLGELYIEGADYKRSIEIANWTKEYDEWKASPTKNKSKPPKATYNESEAYLQSAVATFRKMSNTFASNPRVDAILFSLAGVLNRLNDDNAMLYYKQLVANHPKSPLLPDAYLAMGEYYFDKHKIADATTSYQKVMDFKNHKAYPYAVYKLGWCYYNSQGHLEKIPGENLGKSVAAFKLVVKLSTKAEVKNFNLRDEALRDLVMAFAETEDTEAAWQYFKTIGEEGKFYAMLERLGNMYSEAGKSQKAVDVYKRLLAEVPNKPTKPEIYKKLVELYDTINQPNNVLSTIKSMHTEFVSADSTWSKANVNKPDSLTAAQGITEKVSLRFGTLLHSRGQKTKNKSLEEVAAQIYTLYLASFETNPNSYDVRFYLADIQYAAGSYKESSANYKKVAQQRPKDGAHLNEAAFMAVASMSKHNDSLKLPPVPPPGQVPKPLAIPEDRMAYTQVIDLYVELLPKEKDGISMRYTAAQIYFDYGHYDKAMMRFQDLAKSFSTTKQGLTAARVVLSFYNERKDWTNLADVAQKYQENKGLMADSSLAKIIKESYKSALFNQATSYETSNKFSDAATAFLKFQKTFPQDENADRALYNASVNYFKAGQIDDSLKTQSRLLNEYPKSELCTDVTISMAETYEAIAKFKEASESYRSLAQKWPNDKRAPLVLFNAGVLLRGIHSEREAANTFTDLYKKYPTSSPANDAIFEAARLREKAQDFAGATLNYKSFLLNPINRTTEQGYYAESKLVELALKSNPKDEQSRKNLAKLAVQLTTNGKIQAFDARRTVAQVLFNEQEPHVTKFKASRFNATENIETQAAALQARLESLAKNYETIIALGNAEFAVASLYRLGEAHEEFSKAFFQAPTPTHMNQQEANAYKSQLEKVAFPLKTEANNFFETAYKRSQEVESFSDWTSRTFRKMAELSPQKYRDITEQSASPGYLTYKLNITDATKTLAH
jgi:TolA-binding protein